MIGSEEKPLLLTENAELTLSWQHGSRQKDLNDQKVASNVKTLST